MITEAKQVVRSAVVSACGRYRYELGRTWGHSSVCGWIMLNPSTADGHQDDPTVRRCMAFARAWGYATIVVRNLYALRATDPRTLWVHPQPVGEDNDAYLMESVEDDITVCAWGAQGRRGNAVINALSDAGVNLHYLALTKASVPRHPLYLPGHLRPVPFARGSAA